MKISKETKEKIQKMGSVEIRSMLESNDTSAEELHVICTLGINAFKIFALKHKNISNKTISRLSFLRNRFLLEKLSAMKVSDKIISRILKTCYSYKYNYALCVLARRKDINEKFLNTLALSANQVVRGVVASNDNCPDELFFDISNDHNVDAKVVSLYNSKIKSNVRSKIILDVFCNKIFFKLKTTYPKVNLDEFFVKMDQSLSHL